jgi:glycosyltransferase involved in cell wall biosynthesis
MADIVAEKPSTIETGGAARIPVVLQLVSRLDAGLAARVAIDTAIAVARAGGRALVASGGGPYTHELERAGIRHIPFPVTTDADFARWSSMRRLRRLLHTENVSIVHTRSLAATVAARHAAAGRATRVVSSYYELVQPLSYFKRRKLRQMTRADRVISPSAISTAYLRTEFRLDPTRIAQVPPGVNVNRFGPATVRAERIIKLAQQWRVPDDRRIVLVPTTLEANRGHRVVIEAMSRIDHNDIYCLIVGAKPETQARREELEKLIEKKNLGGFVYIVDHCNDMPAAYMLADAVVVADREPRAFSRVVIEAQAMGRPVIASSAGGIAEPVEHGQTGWVVPVGDADALARSLRGVLGLQAGQRAQLADAAIAHARQQYALETVGEQILAVYDSVLETLWAELRT